MMKPLRGNERRIVRPVLEQPTMLECGTFQMFGTIVIEARTKNQVMRAVYFLNGIHLHEAKLLHDFLHGCGASTPSGID